jgi:hypothetical protein
MNAVFDNWRDLLSCQRLVEHIPERWRFYRSSDRKEMDVWKSESFGGELDRMNGITSDHAAALEHMIATRGSEWMKSTLLPKAIEKNVKAKTAFPLSLTRLLLRGAKTLSDVDRAEALAMLASSTIDAITFASGAFRSYKCLVNLRSGLVAAKLDDELTRFQNRILQQWRMSNGLDDEANMLSFLEALTGDMVSEEHAAWFRDIIETYIIRVVGFEPEKPRNWIKSRKGCGRCDACDDVDRFLVDADEQTQSFSIALTIRKHVASRFGAHFMGTRNISNKDGEFTLSTDASTSPHSLNVTKHHHQYKHNHIRWASRADREQRSLNSLAMKDRLRTLLGAEKTDDVVSLRIVTLRRDSSGATSGTYLADMPESADCSASPFASASSQEIPLTRPTNIQSSHAPAQHPGTKRPASVTADSAKRRAVQVAEFR